MRRVVPRSIFSSQEKARGRNSFVGEALDPGVLQSLLGDTIHHGDLYDDVGISNKEMKLNQSVVVLLRSGGGGVVVVPVVVCKMFLCHSKNQWEKAVVVVIPMRIQRIFSKEYFFRQGEVFSSSRRTALDLNNAFIRFCSVVYVVSLFPNI